MTNKKLPRNVVLLGLVSFFNDFSSEMIYPLVPIFLTTVLHASVPIVGLIEGFVEAVASITKYFFGTYSDYLRKRKPFVVLGYSFAAVSKLLIGLAFGWPLVLLARFVDRFGKGLRTAPRDSLLLEEATTTNKGYIFGFHRAFDSLGAVVGPLAALALLYFFKENMRLTFFLASIPAAIAVTLLVLFVHEKKKEAGGRPKNIVHIALKSLRPQLLVFLGISFLFSLGNSSDAFLLLQAHNLGLSTTLVVLTYVLYNISQTVLATPLGILSDRLGARKVYAAGLFVFSLVYFFFGAIHNPNWLWILFPVYGIYIAATDGVSKAYIAEFITKEQSGTYFGAYYTMTAIATFLASLIGGFLWHAVNPSATFYYGSIMAFLAFVLFEIFQQRKTLEFRKIEIM